MNALDATLWAFPAAFALHVAEEAVFNVAFHAATRAPGLRTAASIVLPLWLLTTIKARRVGLLDRRAIAASLALGGPIHAAAVAHQVYRAI